MSRNVVVILAHPDDESFPKLKDLLNGDLRV